MLSAGGNSYENACVCWGRGSAKSVDRTPLRYQAIESKNDKKKTIKQKRKKENLMKLKAGALRK